MPAPKSINMAEHIESYLKTAFCLPPVADLQFEGGLADAHADPHAGGEALQMLAMQQVLRQLQLPLPAHADTPGNQALQVSSHFPSLPLSSTFDGRGAAMKTEIALASFSLSASIKSPLSDARFVGASSRSRPTCSNTTACTRATRTIGFADVWNLHGGLIRRIHALYRING